MNPQILEYLRSKDVHRILNSLVSDMINDLPDNVTEYAANWFHMKNAVGGMKVVKGRIIKGKDVKQVHVGEKASKPIVLRLCLQTFDTLIQSTDLLADYGETHKNHEQQQQQQYLFSTLLSETKSLAKQLRIVQQEAQEHCEQTLSSISDLVNPSILTTELTHLFDEQIRAGKCAMS
eukprot:PhF_6_TR34963/c1_g1_i1/m.50747